MGGLWSRPLLGSPWRKLPENNDENLDFVRSYEPINSDVQHIRILFHGPVGAGKSSFINSVESILQGRITDRAPMDAISGGSYSRKYQNFKIRKDHDGFYSFMFNDVMGYEKNTNSGISVEDLKLALKGHVREKYEFSTKSPLKENDPFYNPNPTLQDKVHVLVSVVPAFAIPLLNQDVVKKMREVRKAASDLDIPQLALITKVDEDSEAAKNISNAHKSKFLKQQVDRLNLLLGISPNRIFLVKNFSQEMEPNEDTNALILYAMKHILQSGEDFLNNLDAS